MFRLPLPTRSLRPAGVGLSLVVALFLSACGGGEAPSGGARVVSVWFHTGQSAERETLLDQIERFHARQGDVRVDLTMLPEGSYDAQVQAAALAGDLPDLLELDGPYLYRYVWQGHLAPLDDLLPAATVADLLPSIVDQGTYRGRLWALGTFDSGLCLFGSRRLLAAAGVRLPSGIDDAWTADEANAALAALAELDPDGAVLDLKRNYDASEWRTYAFSPVLQSAGADLIDRETGRSAGVLDGPAAVTAMARLQSWLTGGLVDPNLDDAAFVTGRVALSWVGHWEYRRYAEALGDDLVLMPLPDFGEGPRTGQGSWAWALTRSARDPEAAAAVLAFLLEPDEVLRMADANGAVPARRAAIERSALYGPGGPLALLVEQLETIAVPRPKTPAYPIVSSAFAEAFGEIGDGVDPAAALGRAAARIDRDFADNRGYPPSAP
jgi:multiple sugar transport system substrate-binding protein